MTVRTLKWVEETLSGSDGLVERCALAGRGDEQWFGATVDTRMECSGRIFFAIQGENTDGHMYAQEAVDRGCSAVVLEKKEVAQEIERAGGPWILVRDTLVSLQELARAYRRKLKITVIAITGSSGKTTTKEFTRLVLKQKYRVHGSPQSYNSKIGVPLTILETGEENEFLVSEVGANQAGEIDFLGAMLKPDIGVVTNIGEAHIGFFGSRENIARTKAELLGHLGESGYAVLPGDDEFLQFLEGHARCRIFTFGFSEGCSYRITETKSSAERIEFTLNGQAASLKALGRHNLNNAAAALAVGDLCGVEFERSREGLLDAELLSGRGKVHKRGEITVIDDSYNANPSSMRASLETMMGFGGKRRIAVLGDMKELGEHTQACHRDLGAYLAGLDMDRIYWVGECGGSVEEGYRQSKGKHSISIFADAGRLIRTAEKEVKSGDIVLVKGSRACKLERVVSALLAARPGEES